VAISTAHCTVAPDRFKVIDVDVPDAVAPSQVMTVDVPSHVRVPREVSVSLPPNQAPEATITEFIVTVFGEDVVVPVPEGTQPGEFVEVPVPFRPASPPSVGTATAAL